jgi:diguanylate cyclase (GGDEF)-like protein
MKPAHSKVLLVDDDPAMLRIVSKWLEKAGYDVQHAEDGQQALSAIEANCPDFLITDWLMPNMDGLELCRRVRELNLVHYVYTIFLTVKSGSDEAIRGLEVGADDFLTKPVNQAELVARMRAGSRVLELERRLGQMARTDALTGLVTQRTFYVMLQKEWARANRGRLPLSCVMVDIDFFKRINDLHGHPVGDAVLKEFARLLEAVTRSSDTVSRYGGEEFCVMLPETRECDAILWAERARKRLGQHVVRAGGKELRVTASFGAAEKRDDTQSPEQLVDEADQALLCAKQSGRDRVVAYESLNRAEDVEIRKAGILGGIFEGITALHVMTPMVVCLREDQSVGHAAEFFLRSRINSTPVVDREGKLSGFLSEKDLMSAMVTLECWNRPVREVMRPNVICYEEDTPIQIIYEFLCRVAVRRIVINKDGRPTGTISRGTLLRWFRNCVLASGLMDSEGLQDLNLDPYRSKERLAETARTLSQQASELHERFQNDAHNLMPHVVGGATRMQELVDDLLAFSRYANESTTRAAAVHSMMLASSHTD